jgi:hypothetical protein
MRKASAIFFLSLFLLSYTELGQLVKLPKIITHYLEHKKWEPEVSFLAFFQMHYFSDDNNAGDDAKDNQLPFKEHNDCQTNSTINFAFHVNEISIADYPVQTAIVYPQSNDESASSSFKGSIFQPPRVS